MRLSFSDVQNLFSPIKRLFQPELISPIPEEDIFRPKKKKKRLDFKRFIPTPKEYVKQNVSFMEKPWKFAQKMTPHFLTGAIEAFPFKPEQLATPILRKRGIPEEEIERRRIVTAEPLAVKLEEKISKGVGAGVSHLSQFYFSGKIAESLLSGLGKKYLQWKVAQKVPGASLRYAPDIIKGLQGLIKGGYISAKAAPYLKGALQWGIYSVPRLKSPTLTGKARELAGEMITGGALNQIAAVKDLPAIQKYLATTIAPALIKATVAGKPEEAPEELLAYGLWGLPFLALAGIKEVKPKPPSALLPFKAGEPPPTPKGTELVRLVKEAYKAGDKKAAKALYKEAIKEVKLPKFEEIVTPPTREIIKVEKPEGVKTALATIRPDKTAGMFIEISKEAQRTGLGTKVVKDLENKLIKKGIEKASISAFVDTQGFWEKQGYSVAEGAVEKRGMIKMEKDLVVEKPERVTVAKLEKEAEARRFTSYLEQAPDQDEYIRRVKVLSEDVKKPEVKANKKKLTRIRATANKEIARLTGVDKLGWKTGDFAQLQILKTDPEIGPSIESLETLVLNIDRTTGGKAQKGYEVASRDLGLPAEGKYYIPYGKYTTRGTGNLEWVRQNIPLLHMGNKRGMLGYAIDVLGIKQKDLGNIVPSDVSHLKEITNVVDLFGGSGLLSNVSKKFFPGAKITYNELDSKVLRAIEKVKKDPRAIQRFVSEVAKWLHDKPGADWLTHFNTVYKGDPDFLTAAKLIEAAAGRVDLTPIKLRNLIKAIPNFSKTFKGINVSNKDALGLIDKYIREGTSKDFLWIDPPYLWSTGYQVGAEMEKAEGFTKLLDKLEKLNDKGVKFVFFNNDPEVQVEKAGREAIHLENIIGRINKLSEQGMIVVRGVNPIGAAKRREMMITNLEYGLENSRLLNLKELQKSIEEMRGDPAAAPREVLKMYRDIIGTSKFAPEGKRITAGQIKTIRTLRKRLRIKNRELIPVLDELLGDTSFAKMTREDGKKMIDWLQPRNWDVIEKKVELTREMLATERKEAVLGDRFVSKDKELENKFGVLATMNKTVGEMENLVKLVKNLPMPEKPNWDKLRRISGGLTARYLSEDLATKILGVKGSFHTPMRTIINISRNHTNRMKKSLTRVFEGLSDDEKKQVVYLQAGAKKFYKGKITDQAKKVADYIQEVSEANLAIINRLRAAKGQNPLKTRKPYIPYIIDQDIAMAVNLFNRSKFWEQRTKTPRDFAAGLFTKDPGRIIEIWSQSCGSWLKKNLYGALMMDRAESIFKVSDAASAYVREMVNLDIYDMIPEGGRLFKSIGRAINEGVGSIFPKKIPVDEELAQSILNTTFGQELKENISEGYLKVPRVEIPNLSVMFHRVFYPAKLAWNFSFALLNRTQPWAALPFVGVEAQIAGNLKLAGAMFPWNRKTRKRYVELLEESGYQFGRMLAGQELPEAKQKIGKAIDRSINFLGDITELANRLENMYGAEYFLTRLEKKAKIEIPQADKERVAATFSAFVNFLGGKGYAPVAQRTTLGKFLYTFQQYPINQLNVYQEMLNYALKDKGAAEFWKRMGREGGVSEEAQETFNKLPPKSRARVFLIMAAIAIPIAMMYALSRSWNVASRALPGLPRLVASDLITAVTDWGSDPTEKTLDKLKKEIKRFFNTTAKQRLEDALNIYDYGVLQSSITKRPLFVQRSLDSALRVFIFGRSSLEEYEKRFPGVLGEFFGQHVQARKVKKLQVEREKIRGEETEAAVEFVKKLPKFKTGEEAGEFIKGMKEEGNLTEGTRTKIKQYFKEQATGVGGMERSIIGLKDEDQARFVLDELKKIKTGEEAKELISRFKRQGILTDNVKEEMKKLVKEGL